MEREQEEEDEWSRGEERRGNKMRKGGGIKKRGEKERRPGEDDGRTKVKRR